MASQQQIEANRRNAQKSTGPKTPEGRAAVRFNALKHGLTAKDAVIDTENRAEFDELLEAFRAEQQPVGLVENMLLEQIVMAAWRLRRLRQIETGFFNLRLIDLAEEIADDYTNLADSDRLALVVRDDCLRANTLPNLSTCEARIERSFYRALRELQRLQAARPQGPAPPSPAPVSQPEPNSANQSQLPPDSSPVAPSPPAASPSSVVSPSPRHPLAPVALPAPSSGKITTWLQETGVSLQTGVPEALPS